MHKFAALRKFIIINLLLRINETCRYRPPARSFRCYSDWQMWTRLRCSQRKSGVRLQNGVLHRLIRSKFWWKSQWSEP